MIEIAIILAIGILMTIVLLMILMPLLVFSEQQDNHQINKEHLYEWKKIQNSITKLEKSIKENKKNENKKN